MEAISEQPKSRDELVRETGIARTTLYDDLKKLIEDEIVKREKSFIPRGRPIILFGLTNANDGYWDRIVPKKNEEQILNIFKERDVLTSKIIHDLLGMSEPGFETLLRELVDEEKLFRVKKKNVATKRYVYHYSLPSNRVGDQRK